MKKQKLKGDVWGVSALVIFLLYLLFLLWPMYAILKSAVFSEAGALTPDNFVKFFSQKYYFSTLLNSFKLSLAVTVVTLAIGTPMAYFYNMYEIRGKSLLQVIIILCCMSAPFIGAYSWIMLLGRSGVLTKFFEGVFGVTMPSIYGFQGMLFVLSLQLFPLIFLYISGAMKNIDNSLLEAASNIGCGTVKRFFKVFLPLVMPTMLAGALLVFMRAMADFGTPMLIGEGYRTFPVEIYKQYLGEVGSDKGFASAISIVAILITAVVFLAQKWLADKTAFTMSALKPIAPKKAKGAVNILVHLFVYGVALTAFMPQCYLIYTSFKRSKNKVFQPGYSLDSYRLAFSRMGSAIQNTFILGLTSLAVLVVLAVFISYLVVRRSNALTTAIDTISMLPYIIPGSVVGIALVSAFSRKPLVLTGTAAIMIVALVIRRLPYTIRSTVASLQQIPMSIEEAAVSLGTSQTRTFFRITVPMMSGGIISGAILSWVTIITELATAIILYTNKTETLTLAIYTQVSRGNYGVAAALSSILTACTILSMLLFMKVSKGKDISL